MARILIIEDYPSIQTIYKNVLAHAGHTVTTVTDGHAALEATKKDQFDVIILDILLPNMDGLAFLRTFDPHSHPHTEVIITTNMDEPTLRSQALELGALKYLLKTSLNPPQLLTYVEETLRHNAAKNHLEPKA